jgi:hypothetical protein
MESTLFSVRTVKDHAYVFTKNKKAYAKSVLVLLFACINELRITVKNVMVYPFVNIINDEVVV